MRLSNSLPILLASLASSKDVGSAKAAETNYPIEVSNCHLTTKVEKAPERVVVASSGALEIMLAMGLENKIAASCWVKEVWKPLMPGFEKFKHYDKYPTHDEMFALNPDFIYATYSSAFDVSRVNYTDALDIADCELVIESNVYGEDKKYCRKELHDAGIGTYLSSGYCEIAEHRPEEASVDHLFKEVQEIGSIFNANDKAEKMMDEIKADFKVAQDITAAGEVVEGGEKKAAPRVLWFDMYNSTSGTNPTPDDPQPYVGACCGGPQIILDHAGATNVFADKGKDDRRVWDYVKLDEWAAADPDLIVLVELSTEGAEKKLSILCTDPRTKDMRAVQERNFIVVPFAASNLGVRLGALAYNMAEAMAALGRGAPLNSVEFTVDPDGGEAISTSGAKVYTKDFPMFEDIDLEKVCPGTPKNIEVKDLSKVEEVSIPSGVGRFAHLGWASVIVGVGLISVGF